MRICRPNKSQTEDEKICTHIVICSQFASHEKPNGVVWFVDPSQKWLNWQRAMNNNQQNNEKS